MKEKVFKHLIIIEVLVLILFVLVGCTDNIEQKINETKKNVKSEIMENNYTDSFEFLEQTYKEGESYISSAEEFELKDSDGKKKIYTFVYNGDIYTAVYTKDNWHVNDSYKIRNKKDIKIICEALINAHLVHGADMKSYRTADDMMYEWVQHNIAYDYLPNGNSWKSHAKDVDLNPADQGKSLKEMYKDRINK